MDPQQKWPVSVLLAVRRCSFQLLKKIILEWNVGAAGPVFLAPTETETETETNKYRKRQKKLFWHSFYLLSSKNRGSPIFLLD